MKSLTKKMKTQYIPAGKWLWGRDDGVGHVFQWVELCSGSGNGPELSDRAMASTAIPLRILLLYLSIGKERREGTEKGLRNVEKPLMGRFWFKIYYCSSEGGRGES